MAFAVLFVVSFVGHAASGTRQYNAEQRLHGQAPVAMHQYLGTAHFWCESFQNWQSEFLAVGSVVVWFIWLRERESPKSKPVHCTQGGAEVHSGGPASDPCLPSTAGSLGMPWHGLCSLLLPRAE